MGHLRDDDGNTLLSTRSNIRGQLGRESEVEENEVTVRPVKFTLSHDGELPSLDPLLVAANSPSGSSGIEVCGWELNEHDTLELDHTDDVLKPIKIWPD
jgi:protein ATS1